MLKSTKIKKSEYSDLEKLIKRLNLIGTDFMCEGNTTYQRAYVERMFIGKSTKKLFDKALTLVVKKEYPYLDKRRIQSTVGLYWLKWGPVVMNDDSIAKGYVLYEEIETSSSSDNVL